MLKEQDPMIEFIREWIIAPVDESAGLHLSTLEVFQVMEEMVAEHVVNPECSRLRKYLPKVRSIFAPLPLREAVAEYDSRTHFLSRKRVPPTFKEVRHILNIATATSIAPFIKMVTFDADDTIYEDGGTISAQSRMVQIIVELLKRDVVVSLVTAAGYPGNPKRYEQRLRGILDGLEVLSPEQRSHFLVMGGECNYLFETYTEETSGKIFLKEIDGEEWKEGRGERWKQQDIDDLLDIAQKTMQEMIEVLELPAQILRKERSVGLINASSKRISYENLEEICLTAQAALRHCSLPFCAFNGGKDVWVDVGNKALGIMALQKYVMRYLPKEANKERLAGKECLHVGDRFTRTGNDTRSRDVATTIWVSDPRETTYIMRRLLHAIDTSRDQEGKEVDIDSSSSSSSAD